MKSKKIFAVIFMVCILGLFNGRIEIPFLSYNSLEKPEILSPAENTKQAGVLEKASVVRVKDGDTIVASINGEKYTVRMIGINTPESVHTDESRNTPEGKAASAYTKDLLPVGTEIYLEYDEDKYDPYDRILAYIWLNADADTTNYEDFCKYNAGALIMQNTYCEAAYYAPNGKYREWYELLDE